MSRDRARTGLAKPREIERELLETTWRERRKNPLGIVDPVERERMDAMGAEFRAERAVFDAMNEVARTLRVLAAYHPEAAFRDAFEDMMRLGLTGRDLGKIIRDMTSDADDMEAHIAVHHVKEELAGGASLKQALERAAAERGVKALSFAAAVQQAKRWWYARTP